MITGGIAAGDDFDEDIFECRAFDLNLGDWDGPEDALHGLLFVHAIIERDHMDAFVDADIGDALDGGDCSGLVCPPHRVDMDCTWVEAVADVAEGVVEDFFAFVDHDDVIADGLGLLHDMGREDDRSTRGVLVVDEIAEEAHVDGVES